jgi:hypothetical protein
MQINYKRITLGVFLVLFSFFFYKSWEAKRRMDHQLIKTLSYKSDSLRKENEVSESVLNAMLQIRDSLVKENTKNLHKKDSLQNVVLNLKKSLSSKGKYKDNTAEETKKYMLFFAGDISPINDPTLEIPNNVGKFYLEKYDELIKTHFVIEVQDSIIKNDSTIINTLLSEITTYQEDSSQYNKQINNLKQIDQNNQEIIVEQGEQINSLNKQNKRIKLIAGGSGILLLVALIIL